MLFFKEKKVAKLKKLGIYIHIPFCVRKCDYCDFYSLCVDEMTMDHYLKALKAHLTETAATSQCYQVDTIYFGGGTPSYFGGERIAEVIQLIERKYKLAEFCEVTVECNPDSVTRAMLRTLRKAGVNRLSIGLQSIHDEELEAIGRVHDFTRAESAYKAAREAKFDNISLDLIYGLPGQTFASWKESVEKVIELDPEHLSCYGLKVEEGTPLWEYYDDYPPMADDDMQADMYAWMVERLKKAGYQQYEISNFAKPDFQSQHNLKYWRGEEYLGFGPSAHSFISGRRYSFVRDLELYVKGVMGGGSIIDESEQISREELSREYIMLRMRTMEGIEEEEYCKRFYLKFEPLEERLQQYRDRGWAVFSNNRWHFTTEGFLLSNALIGELLELQAASAQSTMLPLLERRQQAEQKE